MRFDQRENLLELDSETGEIKLNGYELQRVSKMDIHMSGVDDAKVMLDLDINPKKILLLIEGKVKWFEGVDREKYSRGHDNQSFSTKDTKEILRQQLELLAKESKRAYAKELPALTNAMVLICSAINGTFE